MHIDKITFFLIFVHLPVSLPRVISEAAGKMVDVVQRVDVIESNYGYFSIYTIFFCFTESFKTVKFSTLIHKVAIHYL